MRRKIVKSSNLGSIGYDDQKQILEIRFKDSSVYQYYDVEKEIYAALMKAPSKGSYFHEHIRNRYLDRKMKVSLKERKEAK